jgi:hypothetical protein
MLQEPAVATGRMPQAVGGVSDERAGDRFGSVAGPARLLPANCGDHPGICGERVDRAEAAPRRLSHIGARRIIEALGVGFRPV